MSWACARGVALDRRIARAWRAPRRARPACSSRCVQPRIALSGVRSSCDSVAEELVLQPVRLLGLCVQLFPLEGLTLPIGEVAHDLREPLQFTGFAADGRHHLVAPESRSVLADAPALSLRASVRLGCPQLLLRYTALPILGCEEHGEVLPDDVVGGVPGQPLRRRRPARDPAGHIEHDNRVIADAFDEQPILLLADPQRLRRLMLGRGVVHHLREPDRRAFGAAHDRHDAVRVEAAPVAPDVLALVLGPAGRERLLEFLRRTAERGVLWREQRRKRQPDELALFIAEHAPHAGVPRLDRAGEVDEEDRVLSEAVEEQPPLYIFAREAVRLVRCILRHSVAARFCSRRATNTSASDEMRR